MSLDRRSFLGAGGLTAAGMLAAGGSAAADQKPSTKKKVGRGLNHKVLQQFADLPGTMAVKIYAPGTKKRDRLLIEQRADQPLVIGSAFKTFVLAEALHQYDMRAFAGEELVLDEKVWSPGAPMFNPPKLTGRVSQRTALEAMIMHSDNTATDMTIKQVGIEKVRRRVAAAGLRNTHIPDSTRSVIGYICGAKDPNSFTWADWVAFDEADKKYVGIPGKGPQPMLSTADDMVAWYEKALADDYFDDPAKTSTFRRIQTLGDAIWLLPLPLGVSAFVKGGSADVPGFHAVCVPGAMYFDDQWVYFCLTLNWDQKDMVDPQTLQAFAAAGSAALQLVKDALAR